MIDGVQEANGAREAERIMTTVILPERAEDAAAFDEVEV